MSLRQSERIRLADMRYPVDFLMMDGRPWIFDGVRRIAKLYQDEAGFMEVRYHRNR